MFASSGCAASRASWAASNSHCEQVFPRLKALGEQYDITIIGRKPYIAGAAYDYQGLRVVPLPALKNKYLEAITNTALAVFYARFVLNAQILHIHGIGPALLGPLVRLLGMKLVVTHHGQDFERQKWNAFAKAVLRLGERCATTAANRVIVVSKSVTEELRRRHPRLRSRIDYIPNGATEFPDAGAADDDRSVLAQFGLEPRQYILGVGRLVPEKGFHDLIAAFYRANPACKLAIAGAADHEDDYSRSLLRHANERIRFCGFQSHDVLRVLYRNAVLFVLPSSHEGLPIAALEAANLGVPVRSERYPAEPRYRAGAGELLPGGRCRRAGEKAAGGLRRFPRRPRRDRPAIQLGPRQRGDAAGLCHPGGGVSGDGD